MSSAVFRILRSMTGDDIRSCIQSEKRKIDPLNEHGTRLVPGVVTGKLDVRATALAGDLDEPESITGPAASAVLRGESTQGPNVVTRRNDA